jgi:hypothetical protein
MPHSIEQNMKGGTKLYFNKKRLFVSLILFAIVGFVSGCASKQDNSYYNRAINASEKAHNKLDRE